MEFIKICLPQHELSSDFSNFDSVETDLHKKISKNFFAICAIKLETFVNL
jgi:hypothetical protein